MLAVPSRRNSCVEASKARPTSRWATSVSFQQTTRHKRTYKLASETISARTHRLTAKAATQDTTTVSSKPKGREFPALTPSLLPAWDRPQRLACCTVRGYSTPPYLIVFIVHPPNSLYSTPSLVFYHIIHTHYMLIPVLSATASLCLPGPEKGTRKVQGKELQTRPNKSSWSKRLSPVDQRHSF